MWLTETLCVRHSCSLCFCFYPSPLRLKTTAARRHLSVFVFWMSFIYWYFFFPLLKLWRFVKQPEEGSPAVHRGGGGGGVKQHYLPLLFLSANQRLTCPIQLIGCFLTPEHWGQIPFRWHANYVPVRSWSHPIIFPRRWFLHRQISSRDIYSVSGDVNDFAYLLPVCARARLCVWQGGRWQRSVMSGRMHGDVGRELLVPCLHPSLHLSLHFLLSSV